MRKLLLIWMLLPIFVLAQEGVKFRDLTFEQALKIARAEGKLIFVDCYASWCEPCKYMEEKVFSQGDAGIYFNSRFVCVKYDMEKGDGKKLAKQFNVRAYPTFVLVRPDGMVQHKLVGANDLQEFISRIERGLDKETNLFYLTQLYATGKMNKSQLMNYYLALVDAEEKRVIGQVYDELWRELTEEEKIMAQYWPLFENGVCVIGTESFDFLLEHLDGIRMNVGRKKVDDYLTGYYEKILNNYIMGYVDKTFPSIDVLENQIPKLGVEKQTNLEQLLRLAGMVVRWQVRELALFMKEEWGTDPSLINKCALGYRGILWNSRGKNVEGYEKIGRQLVKFVVNKMVKEKECLTIDDLEKYLSAISMLSDEISGKCCSHLVEVGEIVMEREPDKSKTQHARYVINQYRKRLKGEKY